MFREYTSQLQNIKRGNTLCSPAASFIVFSFFDLYFVIEL